MSLMLDEFVYAGETPWHGLGHQFDKQPENVQEIIQAGNLGWTVNSEKMYTDKHPEGIANYKSVYREDNNKVLGVINKAEAIHSQNVDMFNSIAPLFDSKDITLETAASLDGGRRVFGCFKINEGYKVEDDDIDHYLVVMNEHLKADGKITIMNSPVRVVCQNTLIQALHSSAQKYRVTCTADEGVNTTIAKRILTMKDFAQSDLVAQAEKMLKKKVTHEDIDKLLDELFPLIKASDGSSHAKANERQELARMKFIDCLAVDNLANYHGTQYQVFNALTDFTQHWRRDAEFGVDLDKRMDIFPGGSSESPTVLVNKYMKMIA